MMCLRLLIYQVQPDNDTNFINSITVAQLLPLREFPLAVPNLELERHFAVAARSVSR